MSTLTDNYALKNRETGEVQFVKVPVGEHPRDFGNDMSKFDAALLTREPQQNDEFNGTILAPRVLTPNQIERQNRRIRLRQMSRVQLVDHILELVDAKIARAALNSAPPA